MAARYFEGAKHAALYAKFRPVPPTALISRIVSYLKEECEEPLITAVDVGCGSGQSSTFLAPYFRRVVGTDVSAAQVNEAVKRVGVGPNNNIVFSQGPAETIPEPDNSVHLISASQAAHWFDHPKFFAEGRRVLVKGGVMALYGYEFPSFANVTGDTGAVNEAVRKVYSDELGPWWPPERALVDSRYGSIVIPYRDFLRDEDSFADEKHISVDELVGYIRSWSSYQGFVKAKGDLEGEALLTRFLQKMDLISDKAEGSILKRTRFFLLMARI